MENPWRVEYTKNFLLLYNTCSYPKKYYHKNPDKVHGNFHIPFVLKMPIRSNTACIKDCQLNATDWHSYDTIAYWNRIHYVLRNTLILSSPSLIYVGMITDL